MTEGTLRIIRYPLGAGPGHVANSIRATPQPCGRSPAGSVGSRVRVASVNTHVCRQLQLEEWDVDRRPTGRSASISRTRRTVGRRARAVVDVTPAPGPSGLWPGPARQALMCDEHPWTDARLPGGDKQTRCTSEGPRPTFQGSGAGWLARVGDGGVCPRPPYAQGWEWNFATLWQEWLAAKCTDLRTGRQPHTRRLAS